MADKRYFEFVEGSSSKFWEVWVDGNECRTRYGKIGAAGQTTIKDEGSPAAAAKLQDKLVREKTGKGYVEKGGGTKAAAAPAPAPAAKKAAPPPPPPPAPKAAPVAAAATGEFRRFEFVEGGSSKFWEVKLEGGTQTIRYGKIGTLGQEKVKDFGSADKAQADSDKLIKEKTGKGYAEVAAAPSGPPAPELDAKELKKHLDALPAKAGDDAKPFLVFADWLESKSHPWGKLIALQHGIATAPNAGKRGELEKEEKALLREYGNAIVGGLQNTKGTEFEWHYGFIRKATLGSDAAKPALAKNLQTLLGLPAARLLEGVIFDPLPKDLATVRDWDASAENITHPWPDLMKAIGDLPEQVTHVGFGSHAPGSASAYVQLPDFKAVSKGVKMSVTRLELSGTPNGQVAPLDLPGVECLSVRFSSAAALEAIASSKLPKLARLEVGIGGIANCTLDDVIPADEEGDEPYPERYAIGNIDDMEVYDLDFDTSPEAIAKFMNAKWPATLKHLGIHSANLNSVPVIEAIVDGKLTPQLDVLDLSGGNLQDEAAKTLIATKRLTGHLKELNLERNLLSKDGEKAVKAAFPQAKTGNQRNSGEPEFFMRYVAAME